MSDVMTELIMARVTGEGWMEKDTGGSRHPTNHEVAECAYRLYEARGRGDGHDLEDWPLGERELGRR
jgi:hypothetical protein